MKLKKQDSKLLQSALGSMPKPSHPKKSLVVHVNKPVVNGTSKSDTESPGLETILAQRLASNEPTIRNKTMKKVKKWISQRCEAQESAEAFTEDEMMRLWKGIFYCYWMSDKPLVQEELAESISGLIDSFGSNTSSALLFVASFMSTMGREWVGIDRWRMDKFMMLVRRFLRQCFALLSRNKWKIKVIAKWNEIASSRTVSVNSIADRSVNGKKSNKNLNGHLKSEKISKPRIFKRVALGFQLHFVDVFLEELAKIGGESLKSKAIQALLAPFITELTSGSNEILCQHIENRIFLHLMRQSDAGIAFEEVLEQNGDQSDQGDQDFNSPSGSDDDESSDGEDVMSNEKDPRAGGVNVDLPQIHPDFGLLSDELFKAGSDKNVEIKRRTLLFKLSKQFKDLAAGTYPLGADFENAPEKVPRMKPKKVAMWTLKKETKRIHQSREERKQYKLALKKKFKGPTVETKKENRVEPTKEIKHTVEEQEDTSDNSSKESRVSESLPEESIEINISTNKKNKKRRKNEDDEKVVIVKKKKKKLRENDECLTPDARPVPNKLVTSSLPNLKKTPTNKRINFSLVKNKCSSLQDIDKSISESPQIPFDASKRPKQSALKKTASVSSLEVSPQGQTPLSGRHNVAYNTMLNGKSKFANRFKSAQFILR